jgi:hypothetical protein
MLKLLPFMLCVVCALANASTPEASPNSSVLAMGPDPGGHTGARVTPETTKTDRPEVDAARKAASGSKTESNAPVPSGQSQSNPQDQPSKPKN